MSKAKRAIKTSHPEQHYPESVWADLLVKMAEGNSVSSLVEQGYPSKYAVWYRRKTRPKWAELYEEAHKAMIEAQIDEIIDIADKADPATAAVAKLQVETRRWLASKVLNTKYGDRVKVDATLDVAGAIVAAHAEMVKRRLEEEG